MKVIKTFVHSSGGSREVLTKSWISAFLNSCNFFFRWDHKHEQRRFQRVHSFSFRIKALNLCSGYPQSLQTLHTVECFKPFLSIFVAHCPLLGRVTVYACIIMVIFISISEFFQPHEPSGFTQLSFLFSGSQRKTSRVFHRWNHRPSRSADGSCRCNYIWRQGRRWWQDQGFGESKKYQNVLNYCTRSEVTFEYLPTAHGPNNTLLHTTFGVIILLLYCFSKCDLV